MTSPIDLARKLRSHADPELLTGEVSCAHCVPVLSRRAAMQDSKFFAWCPREEFGCYLLGVHTREQTESHWFPALAYNL